MSELLSNILEDIKVSMKSGEKEKVVCLRGLHSDIKNVGINQKIEITDDVVLSVISKAVKQRKDSAEQFAGGGRQDLVEKTEVEISWVEKYLPAQLSEGEVEELVKNAIAETGATGRQDMGKIMKILMPKVAGKADGKLVSQFVSKALS